VVAIIVVGKFLVTLAITSAFRRPARSALLISASLAQIGNSRSSSQRWGSRSGCFPWRRAA